MTLAEKHCLAHDPTKKVDLKSVIIKVTTLDASDDVLSVHSEGSLKIVLFTDGSLLTFNINNGNIHQGIMSVKTLLRVMAAYHPYDDLTKKPKIH